MVRMFIAVFVVLALALPQAADAQRFGPKFQGTRYEMSEAEADKILTSLAQDYKAGVAAKEKCDFDSYDKIITRIANQQRQAAASRAEVERLTIEMATRLNEIMAELAKFASLNGNPVGSTLKDNAKTIAAGALEATELVPLVGTAVTAIDKLVESDATIQNNKEALRILKLGRLQLFEMRSAYLTITRHRDIEDYSREISLALNKLRVNCGDGSKSEGSDERENEKSEKTERS